MAPPTGPQRGTPQRGAASVAPPPPGTPRAAAAARPGARYGRPESLAGDFGASNGYQEAHGNVAADVPAMNGGAQVYGAQAGGTYGSPAPGDDYHPDFNGYDQDYGSESPAYGDYRPTGTGYPPDSHDDYDGYDQNGYDGRREPGAVTGDPNYRAKRHRPSANDTNVGTLSDFAAYGGYPVEGRY